MKTIRDTYWGGGLKEFEVIPAGTDIRVVTEEQLVTISGSGEARALRECANRMRQHGQDVVYGVFGNVRCFVREDFA